MGNGIQMMFHYYHPFLWNRIWISIRIPNVCIQQLITTQCGIPVKMHWKWGQFGSSAGPFRQGYVPCTPPGCWLLVTLRSDSRGDCVGGTPKAMPAETQVQTLEKWKALGGTSWHRWWHNLKLLMALWWQLVQMLTLSQHSPLSTCCNQLEEKRPHEPQSTSEWKEPYWQKTLNSQWEAILWSTVCVLTSRKK